MRGAAPNWSRVASFKKAFSAPGVPQAFAHLAVPPSSEKTARDRTAQKVLNANGELEDLDVSTLREPSYDEAEIEDVEDAGEYADDSNVRTPSTPGTRRM